MAEYSDGKVDAYEAVKMYRKILAESDTPVDIVTTGYTTNIECLLKSEPDEYSELTGQELVKRKCGQLYVVGATYPEGRCNNIWFAPAARTAADYISKHWPYPILFFTNNVGGLLVCGAGLQQVDTERKDIVTVPYTPSEPIPDGLPGTLSAYGVPDMPVVKSTGWASNE